MKSRSNMLIVDDNQVQTEYLEVALKKLNINLILAKSVSEALGKTKGKELILVIINIQMPKMNGYKLALKINLERSEKKVPVIFLTASRFNEKEVLKGYASGAVDFINKPVNCNILLSKIKVFLNLYNQKQAIIRDAVMIKKNADELTSVNVALKLSEEKYRNYIDNAPDGVFVANESGKYIEVNKAICRMSGYTKEELLKMSISDLLPEESIEDFLSQFKMVFISGTLKADLSFKIKNRTKLWCALEAVKLNENRVLGFIKDINKRFELEESLRTHHIELEMQNNELMLAKEEAEVASQKYSNLYEFAPSGYFTLSADKEIQELNFSGSRLLGLSEQRTRLVNNYFDFFISKTTLPVFNTFFSTVFNSKVKESCEVILETEDNQPKYVHIEGAVADNVQQCHLNIIDITKRKQAEEEIRLVNSFLDSIIENIPDVIFIKDAKSLRFKRINRAGEELMGIPKEEMMDRTDYDFFPKEQAGHFIEKDRNIILTREMMDISEEVIQTRNKGIRVIHTKKVPILNAKGEPEYLLAISEDITERKLAEQLLKVSEEKYKTMLNSSPDGILLIDLDGIITEVSDIGLELFGADTRDDLVGKYFNQFIPSDEKNTLNDIFEKAMNEGLAQNVELKIRKKNQSVFAAETSATLIQESDGTPLSFMLIIRDISQRRKMETKQIHADRMANLGEMASGIAHEINQPLNIISMVMDKILFVTDKTETIDLEFIKTKSEIIFENITRIRNIIDHIRAFSRSHDDFLLTAFDINLSIENAASMIMEQFKHLGIKLYLILDKQILQIVGNTYKFEQVIVNLLTNAKDAVIEKKSKQFADYDMIVEIRTFQENQFLIVEISDNGIGISKDDIHNIMLPFYTTKDEGKGTGLGLSICYQIIKELNGTIDITSEIFHGTRIKLVLEIENKK